MGISSIYWDIRAIHRIPTVNIILNGKKNQSISTINKNNRRMFTVRLPAECSIWSLRVTVLPMLQSPQWDHRASFRCKYTQVFVWHTGAPAAALQHTTAEDWGSMGWEFRGGLAFKGKKLQSVGYMPWCFRIGLGVCSKVLFKIIGQTIGEKPLLTGYLQEPTNCWQNVCRNIWTSLNFIAQSSNWLYPRYLLKFASAAHSVLFFFFFLELSADRNCIFISWPPGSK